MGMSLYDMLSDEHESTLTIGRAAVKLVTVDREMVSPSLWQDLAHAQDISQQDGKDGRSLQDVAAINQMLAHIVVELVKSWRFVDIEGNEGPLTGKDGREVRLVMEEVATLPMKFLTMIIDHVTTGANAAGEATPGETTNGSLNATSSRQAPSANAPNGISTSAPQTGSAAPPGNLRPRLASNRIGANGRRRRWSR